MLLVFRTMSNEIDKRSLVNPEVSFKHRLYVDFDVTLKTISLEKTIAKIKAAKDTYNVKIVSRDCFGALNSLYDVCRHRTNQIPHMHYFFTTKSKIPEFPRNAIMIHFSV